MEQFSLTCLGVGDGHPCADRGHAAFLYRLGETSFLIDCGEPIADRLHAGGVSFDSIDRIFLSHLHADHIGGFFMLMQGMWLARRQRKLTVHLPAHGVEPLREMLNAAMLFEELLKFRFEFAPLRAKSAVTFRNARVTPFQTSHLTTIRERFQKKYPFDFAAFGFLIESGDLRIGHSSDVGEPADLLPLLEKPLDLLVCELAHFAPEEIFRFLKDRPVGRVVFLHLSEKYWQNLEETRRLAAEMLPHASIVFARDNEEITLR